MPEFLRSKLDDMCERLDTGQDIVPHESLIKDAWRMDVFRWARERLKLPIKRWRQYAPAAYAQHRWDGTEEPLHEIGRALAANNTVAVFSATGVGKTFLGAVILLWWLDCWEGSQVITVAPKQEQLALHIWKEVGRLWPLFQKLHPHAELMSLKIRMRPAVTASVVRDPITGVPLGFAGWGATGFVCGVAADEQVAQKARGFHNEHMLFICEETTGINPAILAAIKFTCTAPHNLRLFFGNPDSQFDGLSRAADEPGVVRITASALDHPNVVSDNANLIPGAQSRTKLAEWREQWGEESPIYQSRARGIPPAQEASALIRVEWIKAAVLRGDPQTDDEQKAFIELTAGPYCLGADCANSEAGDKATLAHGKGAVLRKVEAEQSPDTNAWARHHIWPLIDSGLVEDSNVGIDSVGIGAGAINELKRLGAYVQSLNGGTQPWRAYEYDEKFKNLRSQMWWQMRADLQHGRVVLPDDEELHQDLLAPTWRTLNGVIIIESKEDFKKRLGRSPDKGDAAVYWNWVRQARPGLDFGTGTGVKAGPVAF